MEAGRLQPTGLQVRDNDNESLEERNLEEG
jgi:hypothetical protein